MMAGDCAHRPRQYTGSSEFAIGRAGVKVAAQRVAGMVGELFPAMA